MLTLGNSLNCLDQGSNAAQLIGYLTVDVLPTFMPAETSTMSGIAGNASCRKMKPCFTLIVYNDVHYHISSLLLSSQMGKVNKPR